MLLLLFVLSAAGPRDVVLDRVDIIELNHYYDGCGRPVFQQWIFWEWAATTRSHGSHRVVAWRMVDTCRAPSVEPHDDGHRLLWTDQGVLREVRARSYRVTHTQFDPELVDRKVWPSKHRRELSRPLN